MKKKKGDLVKVPASIAIGPKLREWADKYCQENEKSFSALMGDILREFLEKHYPKGRPK